MKFKTVALLGLMAITLTACNQNSTTTVDDAFSDNITYYPEDVGVYETEESESTEVQESVQMQPKKYKKTLADIHISGNAGYSGYLKPSEESEESILTEEQTMSEFTENADTEEVLQSITSEGQTEQEFSTPASYAWDADVYDKLGVHAPSLDDWYKYSHSAISTNGKVYEYVETSTEDPTKTVKIEMCNGQLYISSYFKEWQTDVEVSGKQCEESYNEGAKEGEFLFSKDDIYYKLIFANTSREEFDEIVNHIISYV